MNENQREVPAAVPRHDDLPQLVELYGILFTKFNQEGDGYWGRFNIMVGINIMIFGGFIYVYSANPRPTLWHEINMGLSVGGLFLAIWSIYVLDRLRKWHEHWRKMLFQIEGSFPDSKGWVKPHWLLPETLKKDPKIIRFPGYAIPFFLVFAAAWVILLVLMLMGKL
ncbi:MAG: hypothetical protein KAT05_09105 [Spirochaetes bacterium]|nr:hypothetical protein [Spirochaetota bacterium]